MRVLIFGPSGAGKTNLSEELQTLGLHAVDVEQTFKEICKQLQLANNLY